MKKIDKKFKAEKWSPGIPNSPKKTKELKKEVKKSFEISCKYLTSTSWCRKFYRWLIRDKFISEAAQGYCEHLRPPIKVDESKKDVDSSSSKDIINMFDIFKNVSWVTKQKDVSIDNPVFKLHYKATFSILVRMVKRKAEIPEESLTFWMVFS